MEFILTEDQKIDVISEFKVSEDTYLCLGINICHMPEEDSNKLEALCKHCDNILEREYGFIIKLLEEDAEKVTSQNFEYFSTTWEFPDRVVEILSVAYDAGYRMVEFDVDAKYYKRLEDFDW